MDASLADLARRQLEALLVQPDPQADVVSRRPAHDAHGHARDRLQGAVVFAIN